MTHVTCRLTAKNRDQLRNPTLDNRVWAAFTFLHSFSPHSASTQSASLFPVWFFLNTVTWQPYVGLHVAVADAGDAEGLLEATVRRSWYRRCRRCWTTTSIRSRSSCTPTQAVKVIRRKAASPTYTDQSIGHYLRYHINEVILYFVLFQLSLPYEIDRCLPLSRIRQVAPMWPHLIYDRAQPRWQANVVSTYQRYVKWTLL